MHYAACPLYQVRNVISWPLKFNTQQSILKSFHEACKHSSQIQDFIIHNYLQGYWNILCRYWFCKVNINGFKNLRRSKNWSEQDVYNSALWNLIPGWVEHVDINEVEFSLRTRNLSADLGCLHSVCAIICVEKRIYNLSKPNHSKLTIFHPQNHTSCFTFCNWPNFRRQQNVHHYKCQRHVEQYIKCAEKI